MNHGDCEHLRFAAAVLAGGGATRLGGRDKALLTLPDGRPLLAKLLTEIRAAGIAETLAVTAQPEAHAGFGAAVATDLRPGMGPLGGIETALAHFDGRCDAVLLLPCDLPALTAREMTALLRAFAAGGAPVVFAVTGPGDWHPLCAVARPSVLSAVSAALDRGERKIDRVWLAVGAAAVEFDSAEPFRNLNTPDDVDRWRREHTACPTMIAPDEALRLVWETAAPLPAESVALAAACGRLLAEDVAADRDYPPFRRAMMDGYAVRRADAGQRVTVVGEAAAGQVYAGPLPPGSAIEIMTGAACPAEAEAVVKKEDARREGDAVLLPRQIAPGENIAPQGSECAAGSVALQAGEALTPLGVAVLASFGRESARVAAMPRVAIITTGGELIALSAVPQTGQIRDSNGPMLAAMVQALGLPAPATTHVADDLGQIGAALRAAAAADVILLAGGVSAGKYDLVPRAVADYGARLVFHKVRQKPGKPLLFAVRGHQLIFGLSGNPLGCHLGMHRYVGPALRRLRGEGQPLPTDSGALAGVLAPKGSRTHFVLGRATRPDPYGPWRLEPLPTVSSADIFGPWQANCYIEAPPGREPLATGTLLRFSWI